MIREKILELLAEICDTDEVIRNPNVDLFDTGLLDSFGTVQLLAAVSGQLNVDVAPTEISREIWDTPNKIIAYLEERIG
ncbi:MAG TPA: D-alanine--poly(phosphoribitol) ligase subunit 2 [Spirochaetia bacterium]|nr:D-alanine--poly(phosphoribitol) ligase subunit 2 [Spirochaetia bacterium]